MSNLKKQPAIDPTKLPLESAQQQQMTGPGEIVALISGQVPPENVKQVLEITQSREENNEKERQRQYSAFRLDKVLKYAFALICLGLVSFLLYYLYEKGQNEMAEKLLSLLIGLVAGGIGGYGYAKRSA